MIENLKDQSLWRNLAFIDGDWVSADTDEVFAVLNPADGAILCEVAKCGGVETARAIVAAEKALAGWQKLTAKQRAVLLRNWFMLIMENQDDLALILTAEQGKPLDEARGEIAYGASYIEWFAEEGKRIYGDVMVPPSADKRVVCIKQPVGVVACITPWNFPSAMLTRKMGAALGAGCTVVCKPANETPLSALALAELAIRAGIPAGVINIICGKTAEIGAELTSNPLVRKLTFTGSTAVGKKLMADCAGTVKRTSMELGGNAPFIVFYDADLDEAVAGALICKFRNAGQTCVCANRILVQDTIYDAFVEKLTEAVAALSIGAGTLEGVQMGPVINAQAVDKILELVDDATSKGAINVTGNDNAIRTGCFVEPIVLTNVTSEMRVFREEIFGPVAPVMKFTTEAEAVAMANDTEFGLAAYLYTRDIGRVWRLSEALEYGMVGINSAVISNEMAPFGGIKESGQGREGSKYGLADYLEIKYLCIGGIDK